MDATKLSILLLIWFSPATAAAVANGGLELNPGETFRTVPPGASYVGWLSAGPGDVEFIRVGDVRNIGPAAEGSCFVDLNGVAFTGSIRQDVSTQPLVPYRLSLAISGNPGEFSESLGAKTLEVLWNGQVVGSFRYEHQSSDTKQNLRWHFHEIEVTGSGVDTLMLRSTTSQYAFAGPFIDAISLQPIPEPSTCVLLLIGGVLFCGMASHRRRALQPGNCSSP